MSPTRRLALRVWGLACVVVMVSTVTADVRWKSGDRTPPGVMSERGLERELGRLAARAARRRVVIHMDGPVDTERRAELARDGVRLLSYLGDHGYFAGLDPDLAAGRIAASGHVLAVEPIRTAHKLHPDLAAGIIRSWSVVERSGASPPAPGAAPEDNADLIVAIYVLFHRDVDLRGAGASAIARHGGEVLSWIRSLNGAVTHIPATRISELAGEDAVMFLQPPLPQLDELNSGNLTRTGAGTLQKTPYNLDGTGITVLVYDSGRIAAHPDFGSRLTIGNGGVTSEHSTHVAGTIGGNGKLSDGRYRGMAPNSELVGYAVGDEGYGYLYTDPGDLEFDYSGAGSQHGADIANNSIGSNTAANDYPCSWEGDYGTTGALIDAIAGGSLGSAFRIVWAAGNERGSGRCGSAYRTIAPPSCAKNAIAVGALNSNDDSVTDFTSWGPCDDGRMKPDVSAPGCQSDGDLGVVSTIEIPAAAYAENAAAAGVFGYETLCGTSMASPTVAGIGVLLLQHYRESHPGSALADFRNATLRAVLAQTAQDVATAGPDYRSGFGSVRAVPAVEVVDEERFVESEVLPGEIYRAYVSVGPADTELRVTMAWDDPPGTPNVELALVNDLDLRVVGPDDTVYYPWTLDPFHPADPAVRTTRNQLDTIEQVLIDLPTPGVYRIEIEGYDVADGPSQSFGVAAGPAFARCLSEGAVVGNGNKIGCEAQLDLSLVDCDLDQDANVAETASISVHSDSEVSGEPVILLETSPSSAYFEGALSVSQTDGGGVLQVAEGDTVSVRYVDADDGAGGVDVEVTDELIVDCTAPVATSISVVQLLSNEARVAVDLDEPARATVRYGTSCAAPTAEVSASPAASQHQLRLSVLTRDVTYFFSVDVVDEAGNAATFDNGGACYSLTTLGLDSDNDGVPDATDNCIGESNQGQDDGDADGFGDACDNCPAAVNADQSDTDGPNSFAWQAVSDPTYESARAVVGDIDGDGDADIVASFWRYETGFSWYENLDGEGSFGAARTIDDSHHGATSVFAVDLDGDLDLDVATASYYDDTISWYENLDGQGNFGPARVLTANASGARYVSAADLDGDGDADVMGARSLSDRTFWFENLDGAGTFGAEQLLIVLGDWWIGAGDLDGDDDLDVVAVRRFWGDVMWAENLDGEGSFGPERPVLEFVDSPGSAAIADLDGDLDLDVVVSDAGGGRIVWAENTDGAGNFQLQATMMVDPDAVGAFDVKAVDFDGDLDIDVVSTCLADGSVGWYENLDGAGNFGPRHVIGDQLGVPWTVVTADLDGDADLDVVAGSRGEVFVSWFERGGDGTGDACDNCPTVENDDQHDLDLDMIGDVCDPCTDGDGDGWGDPGFPNPTCDPDNCAEIANAAQLDDDADGVGNACDNCGALSNPGQGDLDLDGAGDACDACTDTDGDGWGNVYFPASVCAEDNCPDQPNPGQVDTDGDGIGDLCDSCIESIYDDPDADELCGLLDNCPFVSNRNQLDSDGDGHGDSCDNCLALANPGQLESPEPESFALHHRLLTEHGESPRDVTAADLDGDGDADLVLASEGLGRVIWYENRDGSGGFAPPRTIAGGLEGVTALAVGDLDGDLDPDVLWGWAGSPDGRLAWQENLDGHGTFGPPRGIAEEPSLVAHLADLDGDGDLDVLAEVNLKLRWYENLDGLGSFGPETQISGANSIIVAVETGDFDGDLDLDIVLQRRSTATLYENIDGAGTFQLVSGQLDADDLGERLYIADLDGDDDLDILAAEPTVDPRILWFENLDGGFSFSTAQVIDEGGRLGYPADVDGDGDSDVIAAIGSSLAWLENPGGGGAFSRRRIWPVEHDRYDTIVTADLDGDLDPDVLALSSADDEVAWFEQGRDGLGDLCDNCPAAGNLDQTDLDGDTVGDACDNCAAIFNPDQTSSDGDAVGDICDNCPTAPNDDQVDLDLDLFGDACDNCPSIANATQEDMDGDLAGDPCDNCPIYNPDQANSDSDLLGDACDNCDLVDNPSQFDRNEDGEGDPCDVDDGVVFVSFADRDAMNWDAELGFDAWNWYRGDYQKLLATGQYTQSPGPGSPVARQCGLPGPGATDPLFILDSGAMSFFLISGVSSGVEGTLGEDSGGVPRPNDHACP